jgi:RNA polymerase sigma-70 factor, ECF subfamily
MEQLSSFVPDDATGPWRADELYLACACSCGCERAQAVFERQFLGPVIAEVRRREGIANDLGDIQQELSVWLLVGAPGRSPGIAGYRGRGRLSNWLRVIALRHLRRVSRRPGPVSIPSDLGARDDVLAAVEAAELEPFIVEAISHAFASLPRRERNMLRHHVVEGLGVDKIAAIYHVHRSTAARRLVQAKASIVSTLEARLRESLRVNESTLQSILRGIPERLDVSVRKLLVRR